MASTASRQLWVEMGPKGARRARKDAADNAWVARRLLELTSRHRPGPRVQFVFLSPEYRAAIFALRAAMGGQVYDGYQPHANGELSCRGYRLRLDDRLAGEGYYFGDRLR